MKVVILAGGKGTRLSEETIYKPKPLVEAHGKPLLWHVMKSYSVFGYNEFIILVGYKGNMIREYFSNFWMQQSDITFDLNSPSRKVHASGGTNWKVTVLETGLETQTAGRLLPLKSMLNETFLLTYGDGVGNVNIERLVNQHKNDHNLLTITGVKPPARFGALVLEKNKVVDFAEKNLNDTSYINGGYFVVEPSVLNYVTLPNESFEIDILPKLVATKSIGAYLHDDYWQPVDSLRDLHNLESAMSSGSIPWI